MNDWLSILIRLLGTQQCVISGTGLLESLNETVGLEHEVLALPLDLLKLLKGQLSLVHLRVDRRPARDVKHGLAIGACCPRFALRQLIAILIFVEFQSRTLACVTKTG